MKSGASGPPPWAPEYGHVSAEVAPVDFRIRAEPEDFRVDELPLFEPEGQGDWLILHVEKRGISTWDAVRRLTSRLGLSGADLGYAGLKDARAVTSQRISVKAPSGGLPEDLDDDELTVRVVGRHPRKLRLGQLAGNRFRLVLRDVEPGGEPRLREALRLVVERGLPNFFGAQRFGLNGEGYELGRLLLAGDDLGYLRALFGPMQTRPGASTGAVVEALERGPGAHWSELGELARRVPRDLAPVVRRLSREPHEPSAVVRAVPRTLRRMHLSAIQSLAFNRVLGLRLRDWTEPLRPRLGDVVMFKTSDSCFVARDDEAELAERAAAGELVATGPLPGWRMLRAEGPVGELEEHVFDAERTRPERFHELTDGLAQRGARRRLWIPVDQAALEAGEPGTGSLVLSFSLPPGAYATSLVEELRKQFRPRAATRPPAADRPPEVG